MIGSGLKKYANESGMKVAKGVAYGIFRGYAVTMSEGNGYKQVVITTKFTQAGADDALLAELNATNIQRTYRVQQLNIAPDGIQIVFMDNPGTMKKIREFMDWFMPLLGKYGATAWNVCTECGAEATVGRWLLIDGVAHYMHDSCAQKVKTEITETEQEQRQQDTGSYAAGAVGAFLGSLVGAVAWAVVLCLGYVASLVGLLIGWLADKGYNLTEGKQGKGKVVVLALSVIFGVVVGTIGGYGATLWMEINALLAEEALPALTFAEFLECFVIFVKDDGGFGYMVGDIVVGLLFAALGVFAMLKKTSKDVSGTKFVDLE